MGTCSTHNVKRNAPHYECRECVRERYMAQRPERLVKAKARYEANKNEIHAKQRIYTAQNRELYRAISRNWHARNTAKSMANTRRQQAARLQRAPLWLTEEDYELMRTIYKVRENLTTLDGIQYHVDHKYPLQGELVSGLHVPSNLRVITAAENMTKSNKYEHASN